MVDSNISQLISIGRSLSKCEHLILLAQHKAPWPKQHSVDRRSLEALASVGTVWVKWWKGCWGCYQLLALRPSFSYTLAKAWVVHFCLSRSSTPWSLCKIDPQEVGPSSIFWVMFCSWSKFLLNHDVLTPTSHCFGKGWCSSPAHLQFGRFSHPRVQLRLEFPFTLALDFAFTRLKRNFQASNYPQNPCKMILVSFIGVPYTLQQIAGLSFLD